MKTCPPMHRHLPAMWAVTAALTCTAAPAQDAVPASHIVAWIEGSEPAGGAGDWAGPVVRSLTDYVFRATSPDIDRSAMRLWVLEPSTGERCLFSAERGLREPR